MSQRLITKEQAAFIQFELENGDARRQKIALQELARRYRSNKVLSSENQNSIERIICGLVLQGSQDQKVVRWCLNCLAQFGRRDVSSEYVHLAINRYEESPEIVAAGVAAHCRMFAGLREEDGGLVAIDPKIKTLAALQNTDPKHLDLSNFQIDIDVEDEEILKLALITVGLNKDVSNLFHPRYTNGQIVKMLCGHDDNIVAQYSVWAVLENRHLTIGDLGLNTDRIDDLPVNVQAKVLQLVAEKELDSHRKHEVIFKGQFLPAYEAREGLVKGLRKTYYDGLEEVTVDWFDQEKSISVKEVLAEHFASYSKCCRPYEAKAEQIFEASPEYRKRLLMAAEGTPLYRRLKAMDMRSDTIDMFGDESELVKSLTVLSRRKVKALFMSASPVTEKKLRVDEESSRISKRLRQIQSPKVNLDISYEWAVKTDEVQSAIINHQPEILHFSGHGNQSALCFSDKDGSGVIVAGQAFLDLIQLHSNTIECVVLNSCQSLDICKLMTGKGIFLIGCDGSIGDNAALAFSGGFYEAIADGRTYEEAFNAGKAQVSIEIGAHADKYSLTV